MELIVYGIPMAAVIVGLTELVKRTANLDARWAPLVAVVFGLLLATLARLDDPALGSWFQVELLGVMAGLSASGLYSGARAALER